VFHPIQATPSPVNKERDMPGYILVVRYVVIESALE